MNIRLLATGLAASLLVSCAAARHRDHMNELQTAVEAYNHAFRWKNYERAAAFLPPSLRAGFIATHEDDAKSLHVEDYRVLQVDLPSEDSAIVTVSTRYTLLPSVTVENRKIRQSWHKVAGAWILESEDKPIRAIKVDAKPRTVDSFGGDQEGSAEVEVTGPDGKIIRDDSGENVVGKKPGEPADEDEAKKEEPAPDQSSGGE